MKLNSATMAACLFLAGCGGGGPSTSAILGGTDAVIESGARAQGTDHENPYVLVEADQAMAKAISEDQARRQRTAFFSVGGPEAIRIGRGDIIGVSIVTTTPNGYVDFTTSSIAPVSQTALEPQEVGADGSIRVPPLGRVRVSGRTTGLVESDLKRELSRILVDPSAIVTIADRRSAKVSVIGKVSDPGQYSIGETNLRLLDMISMAGGPSGRSEALLVKLSRNGAIRETTLEAVLQHANLNVFMRPYDVLELETPEDTIVVLGSGAARNTVLTFNTPDTTLADALGQIGGLAGRTANRKGVFLYREVDSEVLAHQGADTTGFPASRIPTIFRFDLTKPESLFVAKAFPMQDGDILYLAPSLRDAVQALTTFIPGPSAYVGASDVGPGQVFGN